MSEPKRILAIDLETYSSHDIKKAGGYRYAETCEILLFGYAYDDYPVTVIDMAQGEEIPPAVIKDLMNKDVLKTAYNAQFERTVLTHYLRKRRMLDQYTWLDPRQWICSMVMGLSLGLPGYLAGLSEVFGLGEDEGKMSVGKMLIWYFCKPCKATKSNGGRTRNMPVDDPKKWAVFKEYNRRDVEVERKLRTKMWPWRPSEAEHRLWVLDQEINDRGVQIDTKLVANAINIDKEHQQELVAEAKKLTGLPNPSSGAQLKQWIQEKEGFFPDSLTKTTIPEIKDRAKCPEVRRMLDLKLLMSRTSIKKYESMEAAVCEDGRVHGLLQFYGASRTGRWAGRLVQVQNLPRCYIDELDDARWMLHEGDSETLSMIYDDVPDVLSQLIRTAFTAGPGCRLLDADFSAIEARVIAWLADEDWRQEVFKNNGDIYCSSASAMFKVPVVKHGQNGHLRQKGKIAELACIAEGQLVLTDRGSVPIEKVTCSDRVWDGNSWVHHDGVVFRGVKEVIEFDGLTATTDHKVYVEGKSWPIQFGDAATSGAHLIQSGAGRFPIWLGESDISREKVEQVVEPVLRTYTVPVVQEHPMAGLEEFTHWEIEGMSAMLAAQKDPQMAGSSTYGSKATLPKSQESRISKLRGPGDKVRVSVDNSCGAMADRNLRTAGQKYGAGQNRRQWELNPWKPSNGVASDKQSEQKEYCIVRVSPGVLALCAQRSNKKIICGFDQGTNNQRCRTSSIRETEKLATYRGKARVYDILNAGPHHRYTVSGKLVHNCGYGGGIGALKKMGADDMGLSDDELSGIIAKWREASPHIVQFWYAIQKAVMKAIKDKATVHLNHGLAVGCAHGMLFIQLPSGRRIAYAKPQIGENRFGGESITYMGMDQVKRKWCRLETYGGKLVENIVQATARDCLGYAMLNLYDAGYPIVMHIHDEVVMDTPNGCGSLDDVCRIMSQPIPWAKGLILNADGFESPYFKKD